MSHGNSVQGSLPARQRRKGWSGGRHVVTGVSLRVSGVTFLRTGTSWWFYLY